MTQSLEAAARALLAKLKITEANSRPIYECAFVHGVKYTGENYEPEVIALEAALDAIPADTEPVAQGEPTLIDGGAWRINEAAWLKMAASEQTKFLHQISFYEGWKSGTKLPSGFSAIASPPSPDRTQGQRTEYQALCDECGLQKHVLVPQGNNYTDLVCQLCFGNTRRYVAQAAHVAAQADALAALKELVAMLDSKPPVWSSANLASMAVRDAHLSKWDAAWAEARRVIAATGEKG